MSDKAESVKVIVRVRPMSTKEKEDSRKEIVKADTTRAEIRVENPVSEKEAPKMYTFDSAYGPDSTQKQIYDISASPIVGAFVSFSFWSQ